MTSLARIRALCAELFRGPYPTGQGRWDNLKALLVDNTVPERHFQGKWAAVIESINPYEPFGYGEIVIHVLARSIKTGDDFATATAQYNKGFGRFHAPAAEWLFGLLRHIFSDQFPDDDAYELAFDYAEAARGIVTEDLGNARDTGEGRHRYCDPVDDLSDERGSAWGPLHAGLFGGSAERATTAIGRHRETFREIARNQW